MKKNEINENGRSQENDFDLHMKTQDFNENSPLDGTEQPTGVDINTDENIAGSQNLNEPVAEEGEIEKLKAQIDELNDKYLRQAAEFDNFKRRNAKERLELMQTAGRDVITDLLDADVQLLQTKFELEAARILAQNKYFLLQNIIGIL